MTLVIYDCNSPDDPSCPWQKPGPNGRKRSATHSHIGSSNRFLSDGSIGAPETIARAVGGSTAMGYPNIPKSALPNGSDFSADVWIRSCTKSIREADLLLERSPTLVFAGSVTIYSKGHKMDDSW